MDLLEIARKALNTSRNNRSAVAGQAFALDSIAASLLYIAENMGNSAKVSDDRIELVVRRLLDETVKSNPKKKGGK